MADEQDLIGLAIDHREEEVEEKAQIEPAKSQHKSVEPLYKRWHKSGFVSVTPLYRIDKVMIDIGRTEPDTKKLLLSCISYVNAVEFIAYLKAIAAGSAERIFPNTRGIKTPEGFEHYGGSNKDNTPRSRVFKALWKEAADGTIDKDTFVWKNGLFEARQTSTGAFIPDGQPIEATQVMMPRDQIPQIAFALETEYIAFQVRGEVE